MSDNEVQDLLKRLREALKSERVDAETRAMLGDLDADIHRLLDAAHEDDDSNPVIENAKSLEARFAVEHPTAERMVRELIDALSKMGI